MGELMSLNGQVVDPRQHLRPYYAEQHGVLPSHCMEDRPGEGLGPQIPSGYKGEGLAYVLGIDSKEPDFLAQSGADVDEWSGIVANILGGDDHDNCAARLKRVAILDTLIEKPDLVYDKAREAGPVDKQIFGEVVDAAWRVRSSGLAVPNEVPEHLLVPLRKDKEGKTVSHVAAQVVAIDAREGEHVLWDSASAWDAGVPAYGANIGLYPGRAVALNSELGAVIGQYVDEQRFTVAAMAFLGATTLNLPPLNNGQPPRIVRV